MIKDELYIKGDQVVLIDDCNRFIYEVYVNVQFENIFSMVNHKYFTSNLEIPKVIRSFNISKNIEVRCDLYSAPKSWLIENEFILYQKPEKKKRIKKIKDE